jgi:hypothetical protein
MLGVANKFINVLAIPSSLSRSYSTFPLYSWTTLIEIAEYIWWRNASDFADRRVVRGLVSKFMHYMVSGSQS